MSTSDVDGLRAPGRSSTAREWQPGVLDGQALDPDHRITVAARSVPGVSEAQYLALEAAAGEEDGRHELWDRELRSMPGTSPEHNELVFVVRAALRAGSSTLAGGCRVFSESIRVRLSDERYVYPDVVAACPPEFKDEPKPPTLLNPSLIVEMLSPSTEDYDRGRKLRGYQALPSVLQVVLLDGARLQAEHPMR